MRIIEKKEPEKWTLELTCQENKDEYDKILELLK